jgi:hypothetical protein
VNGDCKSDVTAICTGRNKSDDICRTGIALSNYK